LASSTRAGFSASSPPRAGPVKALEAVVPELEVEGGALRYEAVAVAEIPEAVKRVLRESQLDENVVLGLLTLERASMVPYTATGTLRRVEAFIL